MDYPKSVPGVGLVDGRFVDENPATGQIGSLIPAAWGNAVTEELLAVIRASGLEPSEGESAQLLEALERKFSTPSFSEGDKNYRLCILRGCISLEEIA